MSRNLSVFISNIVDGTYKNPHTISYNSTWSELEAMFKAMLDCERVAISYIDTDNEISISSQEELSEAFQVAMKMGDKLHIKILPLDAKAAVFRISDTGMAASLTEMDKLVEPLVLREICPDPNVAIPLPYVEKVTNGVQQTVNVACPTAIGNTCLNPDCSSWEHLNGEPKEHGGLCERNSNDIGGDKSEQLLQYSDFVSFMTKLKKDLRVEIVRDVTRKTIKQILKGLDGAVIESLHGSNQVPFGVNKSVTGAPKSLGWSEHTVYTHEGVYCDVCNCMIVGPRYKCGNCENFDLCEACEDKPNLHNSDHVFIKIRRPCLRVGVKDGVRRPLLMESIYRVHKKTKLLEPIPRNEESNENEINSKLESKLRSIHTERNTETHRHEKMKRKDEKKIVKLKRKEEKIKRRMEGFNESPMKRERLELLDDESTVRYDFYKVMMSAMFLADVDIPDGSKLPSGTKFVKTWRMKNDGDGPWSHSTKLKFLSGNISTATYEVDVPSLKPGEEGNINVDFVSPIEPGYYYSYWKLHENGMPFGVRICCSIEVVPKEILEPAGPLNDSLKVISEMYMSETELREEDIQSENSKNHTIRIQPLAGHPEEFLVKCEERLIQKDQTLSWSAHDVAKSDEIEDIMINERHEKTNDSTNSGRKATFSGEDEYVVYVKHGDNEVSEVENKGRVKVSEIPMSLSAHDLTTAVARLTLESEKQDIFPCVSYTTTPNNTPFDVTPLKTPNPEPEDEADDSEKDQHEMMGISNSSSLELVTATEHEYEDRDLDHVLVRERMASLELKPDIELEAMSSFSDNDDYDDSSLSDSDYIIVPVPDCFDLSKPLRHSTTSGYSNSLISRLNDEEFLLDDNHNATTSSRNSREVSVDEILTTSSSLLICPLSPTPSSQLAHFNDQQTTVASNINDELFVVSTSLELGATSEERLHSFDVNGNNHFDQMPGSGTADSSGKPDMVCIMIGSETQGQPAGGESCHDMSTLGDSLDTDVAVSDPGLHTPIDGSAVESSASGASSAHNNDTQELLQIPGNDITDDNTSAKAPLSSAPKMVNVNLVKAPPKKAHHAPETVDFAPEFTNQLVATAVNAANQAYITAKAVFKTWSDEQEHTLPAKPKQSSKCWKPASTQWTPPEKSNFSLPQSEWKPPTAAAFRTPQSEWKPLSATFKPPQSEWKPPAEATLNCQTESGLMGRLFDMGFFDRDLNRKLLLKYNGDIKRVIQVLCTKN